MLVSVKIRRISTDKKEKNKENKEEEEEEKERKEEEKLKQQATFKWDITS